MFTSESRPQAVRSATFWGLVILPVAILLLLPAVSTPRPVGSRATCAMNLKQIALALHNYHDQHQAFPPAYIDDANGKPMHSWRVLILPFIEQQALYDLYDFDEPWDGPNNRKLLNRMPRVYGCPSTSRSPGRANCTTYFAVVDPSTAWPGKSPGRISDILDGTQNTILVVEHNAGQVPWMAPSDLGVDEAIGAFTSNAPDQCGQHQFEDFFHVHFHGRNVAFADGSVDFVPNGHSRDTWRGILRIHDEQLWDQKIEATVPISRFKVGNCVRLGIFFLLTVFPLPWAWAPPKRTDQ